MKRSAFLLSLANTGLLAATGTLMARAGVTTGNHPALFSTNTPLPAHLFFPDDNAWNTPIQPGTMPDPQNHDILDFQSGGNLKGFVRVEAAIPYNVIDTLSGGVPFITVKAKDEGEDDPFTNRFPYIPGMLFQNGPWSGDGADHHLLVVDTATKCLYEIYQLRQLGDGTWLHEGAAVFNLKTNIPRASGYQDSADAAGLPILPGLVRMDEIKAGLIPHALRMTVRVTFPGYIFPATHGTYTSPYSIPPTVVPMGARFRLKGTVDEGNYDDIRRPIIACLKKYGAFVADNGTNFAITAVNDHAGFQQALGAQYYGPEPGKDNGSFRLLDKNGQDITIGDFELMPMGAISRLP